MLKSSLRQQKPHAACLSRGTAACRVCGVVRASCLDRSLGSVLKHSKSKCINQRAVGAPCLTETFQAIHGILEKSARANCLKIEHKRHNVTGSDNLPLEGFQRTEAGYITQRRCNKSSQPV
jgi:hypothetical protein